MTLILSVATKDFALQVGDRLLTQRLEQTAPVSYVTWDAYANKAVVLYAQDAIISLSFSGQAHINTAPVDDWIVKALYGEDPCPVLDGRRGVRFGPAPRACNLGVYLNEIAAELTRAKQRGDIQGFLAFQLVGLRWHNKEFTVPCFGQIAWDSNMSHFRVVISKRYWGWYSTEKNMHIAALGNSQQRAGRLLTERLDRMDNSDPEVLTVKLIKVIHDIADGDATVGRDCLSILIKRTQPQVLAKYRPYLIDKIPAAFRSQNLRVGGAFSPWIVTPNMTAPPMIITGGGWSFPANDILIEVVGPDVGNFPSLKTTSPHVYP